MPDEDLRLTGDELKKSYWFTTHLRDIRKRIIIACIAVIGGMWLFVFASLTATYLLSFQQERSYPVHMGNQVSAFASAVQLTDPITLYSGVIPASGEAIDLYAFVDNPHEDWWQEIEYHFELGGLRLLTKHDFMMPHSKQFFLQLAEHGDTGSSAQFVIDRVRWHYVSEYHKKIMAQRNRFTVQNISYVPSTQAELARALPISSLTFDFINNTPYSYWEALLPIVAKSGETIVAASLLRLADIKRDETRPVEVRWFHSFEFPTTFEITPHINVLDQSAYRSQ